MAVDDTLDDTLDNTPSSAAVALASHGGEGRPQDTAGAVAPPARTKRAAPPGKPGEPTQVLDSFTVVLRVSRELSDEVLRDALQQLDNGKFYRHALPALQTAINAAKLDFIQVAIVR